MDIIILNRYADSLITSDLQFGFKAKRSTNMCTMILKEAIDYYISNGSSVFCTLLDATKAFDRVDYCRLFRSLMNRDLPPTVLRLLLNCIQVMLPDFPGMECFLPLSLLVMA